MGRPPIGPKMQGAVPVEIHDEVVALAAALGVKEAVMWREIVCAAHAAGILDKLAAAYGFEMVQVEGE
jgi:hypothetical protein